MEIDPMIAGAMGSSVVAAIGWLVRENAVLKKQNLALQEARVEDLKTHGEKSIETALAVNEAISALREIAGTKTPSSGN